MYREHFGLKSLPFSISPDPRYLYMSDQHREALAHLVFSITQDGGFVLLTGEVGTGKTTVCRCLIEQLPGDTDIAFILNPRVTAGELLASLCDEFRLVYPEGNKSIKVFVDKINAYLLDAHARGRKTVLIIEEAQNLGPKVLEQVRLLTNLETNERKLLQIIMIGQPELRDILARPDLRQLSQRITARYHLGPLSKAEVGAYIGHRLSVAGAHSALFPSSVIVSIHRLSSGIPRMINLICDRALLGAYSQGKDMVDKATVSQAAREVFGETGHRGLHSKALKWITALILLAATGALLLAAYSSLKPAPASVKPAEILPVVSSPAEPQKSDTLQWPAGLPMDRSRDMAFAAVFRQWNLPYQEAKEDICKQALSHGLHCFESLGSMENLRGLNRPAVLKFYDDAGNGFYAALTAIEQRTVSLEFAAETRAVDFSEISRNWYGEYTLLWKPPQAYTANITPGSKGPDVAWVNTQLALIDGSEASRNKVAVYDKALAGRVKQFQRARGLLPDGVVGAQTIIHILNASGSPDPRLYNTGDK